MKIKFYLYKISVRLQREYSIKNVCMLYSVPGFFFVHGKYFWFALIKPFPASPLIGGFVDDRPVYLHKITEIFSSKRLRPEKDHKLIAPIGSHSYGKYYSMDILEYVKNIK